MPDQAASLLNKLQNRLSGAARQSSIAHGQFLQLREVSLAQLESLIELQMADSNSTQPQAAVETLPQRPAPLFDTPQLVEFATGSMARCFGPEFNRFEGRRYPRIPNGDLLLMTRVTQINGKRKQFDQPSDIMVEYDVPASAWYLSGNAYPTLPYSVWMEIALQPCGFLSAYLGTSLIFPDMDFFFRNLDGSSQIINTMDVRGKTLVTHARLLSTVSSDNTIIQKFDFEITCDSIAVFKGQSVFGFFPPEVMAKQAGLDAGKSRTPAYETSAPAGSWVDLTQPAWFAPRPDQPHYHLSGGQLSYLDRIFFPQDSQLPLYALRANHADFWFYSCHFYQDPVMPGSLGVEAILQAVQAYALHTGLGKSFKSPHFEPAAGKLFQWKYRGQILPTHNQMKLEVTITGVTQQNDQIIVEANASLWADTVRIYEVKQAAICVKES